jgi:uncharacterized membrane protein YagU involved in acid resistance
MAAKRKVTIPPCVWKGALAGVAGGLAGIAAQKAVEILLPPARKPAGTPLPAALVVGAVYGVAAEFSSGAKAWQGATFGFLLRRLAASGVLPGMAARAATADAPAPERLQSWAGNLAFGMAAESTRRAVRRGL